MIGELLGLASLVGALGADASKPEVWLLMLRTSVGFKHEAYLLLPVSERFLLDTLQRLDALKQAKEGAPPLRAGYWVVDLRAPDLSALFWSSKSPHKLGDQIKKLADAQYAAIQNHDGQQLRAISRQLQARLSLKQHGIAQTKATDVLFSYQAGPNEGLFQVRFHSPSLSGLKTYPFFGSTIEDLLDMMRASNLP